MNRQQFEEALDELVALHYDYYTASTSWQTKECFEKREALKEKLLKWFDENERELEALKDLL